MKIGILSRNRRLYSTQRLAQSARARGHSGVILDTLLLAQRLGLMRRLSGRRFSQGAPIVDGMIPRIGASITRYGVAVVHALQTRGVVTTATADAIATSRDKLKSWQLMDDAGLPVPRTAQLTAEPRHTISGPLQEAVAAVGGTPVVMKVLKGTQGRGVLLAPDLAIARAILTMFVRHGHRRVLIQEFVREARGQDFRLIVVGGECVAAMRRTATAGDFRANLHRGGEASNYEPNAEMVNLALRAANAHGIGVAGVDVIISGRGPLLLEVNSSPGLEGVERVTQVDIAGEIVRFLEQKQQTAGNSLR